MNLSALLLLAMTSAQLPTSPDPRPVSIRGVVVDGAGADVWLADALPPDEGRRFGLELWHAGVTRPGEGTPPILVHARTGPDGSFAVELPAEAVARRSPPPLVVWAMIEGRVALRRLPRIVLADDPPVRIAPGPPVKSGLAILTPDRKPAAGARVVPARVGEAPVPEPVGRSLAAVADAQGHVQIAGLELEKLGRVRVEAEGFGVQTLELDGKADLVLAPVGRIRGRLVTPHGGPVRGVTVGADSQVGGYLGSGQGGSARVACDERGHFEIPAIAAGVASLRCEFDPAQADPLRAEAPGRLVVKAGQTAEIDIPLRETVAVRGLFREKGTNRPIAGVKVALNGRLGGDRFAVTGADGRFTGRVFREAYQPYGWSVRIPLPFFEPEDLREPPQRMPRPGVSELDLPPADLRRGADVRGTVAGEDGRPVAGARVEASWHDSRQLDQSAVARTDRSGGFVLRGVAPMADLDINAWDGFAAASTSIRATSAAERPIALTLRTKDAVPIVGRVVEAGGRPIAGASVRIRRQVRGRTVRMILDDPVVAADGTILLKSGADGRYRTHRRFPARDEYYAEATAPGRLAARSAPIAGGRISEKPPVLVLHRIRDVEGRVVDRGGRPVAGAVVRQSGDGPLPTETSTDENGKFHLSGVIEGPALILADGAGFRPALQPVGDESKPVAVVLARRDEPPAALYRTLPSALPLDEEKVLAHRLIEPLVATILARGDDSAKYRLLVDAARIDPQATIEWLDEARFAAPDYANYLRIELAPALARESLEEATTILEAGSPYARAFGYATLADDLPNLAIDRKRALLGQAILNSKTVAPLWNRFRAVGEIAGRLIDLGDVERARALLDEARDLAAGIPRGDRTGRLGILPIVAPLGRLDRPAAVKLLEDLAREDAETHPDDRSRIFDRHYDQMAYGLADRSPADAEDVLGRTIIRPEGDRAIVAICTRMAPKDLARARRIAAARISSAPLRPYALGLMAQAVAPTDRAAALRLLDEAFDELDRLAAVESDRNDLRTAIVAAALLPAVESIDPDRLAECLGRALRMREPRGDPLDLAALDAGYPTAHLAMLTARYDRGLAAVLLQPDLDRIGSHARSFGFDSVSSHLLAALALIDPRRAVAMVEALPEAPPPGTNPDAAKVLARRSVAKALALHGGDRWRLIAYEFIYLWTPGQRLP